MSDGQDQGFRCLSLVLQSIPFLPGCIWRLHAQNSRLDKCKFLWDLLSTTLLYNNPGPHGKHHFSWIRVCHQRPTTLRMPWISPKPIPKSWFSYLYYWKGKNGEPGHMSSREKLSCVTHKSVNYCEGKLTSKSVLGEREREKERKRETENREEGRWGEGMRKRKRIYPNTLVPQVSMYPTDIY